MKPRLESAPETIEDRAAWWLATLRGGRNVWGVGPESASEIQRRYLLADRRDADLMLSLGTSWATLAPRHTPESLPERTERRLLWLLTRAYGSGLNTQPQYISYFA